MPPRILAIVIPTEQVLKPGETLTLYHPEVAVEGPAPNVEPPFVSAPTIRVEPGAYKLGYGGIVQSHPKLATGTVAFGVKEPREAVIEWGKEVGGLQAGIVVPADASYPFGSKLRMEVKLRNVSKAEVKIVYSRLREFPPSLTDANGKRVSVEMPPGFGAYVPATERVLKPGETVTLHTLEVAVQAEELGKVTGPEGRVDLPTIKVRSGMYKIGYAGMLQSHPKLATGTVEFEAGDVKPAAPETLTAWGEVQGGLQAGLSIGEKRAYHHGEKVTLSIRLRNVGKVPVKFTYIEPLVEHEPVVTIDGKRIPQPEKPDGVGDASRETWNWPRVRRSYFTT